MRSRPFCASLLLVLGCGTPPSEEPQAPEPVADLVPIPPSPVHVQYSSDKEDKEAYRKHREEMERLRQELHALGHFQGEGHHQVFTQASSQGPAVEVEILVNVDVEDLTEAEPTIEDRVEQVLEAETPGEKVAIQEETVDQQIKDADAVNEDLEDILKELRAKKGLPDSPAYTAPTEVAAEKALKAHEIKQRTLHLVADPLMRVHRASLEGDAPAVEAEQESHPDSEKE